MPHEFEYKSMFNVSNINTFVRTEFDMTTIKLGHLKAVEERVQILEELVDEFENPEIPEYVEPTIIDNEFILYVTEGAAGNTGEAGNRRKPFSLAEALSYVNNHNGCTIRILGGSYNIVAGTNLWRDKDLTYELVGNVTFTGDSTILFDIVNPTTAFKVYGHAYFFSDDGVVKLSGTINGSVVIYIEYYAAYALSNTINNQIITGAHTQIITKGNLTRSYGYGNNEPGMTLGDNHTHYGKVSSEDGDGVIVFGDNAKFYGDVLAKNNGINVYGNNFIHIGNSETETPLTFNSVAHNTETVTAPIILNGYYPQGYKNYSITEGKPNAIINGKSYKVYSALLTQTGSGAPVATVRENNIGAIVWSRTGAGAYFGTLAGAFVKAEIVLGSTVQSFATADYDGDMMEINTYIPDGTPMDERLFKTPIEIRVYY